jgi:YebC/PmpR family DNA-binding regulatory protein
MSGHSKWATTKRHKAAVDAKRGKIFSVIAKEMTIAARNGGGDPNFNPRLRTLIAKGKAANMPSDNIDRAIKKGTGELPGVEYFELLYEGYAPGGVGIIVEVTTDNKNRAASAVRSTLSKHGGNLASPGALQHSFSRQGQFLISAEKTTEDDLLMLALEAGAEDVINQGDHFEVRCELSEFDALSKAFEDAELEPDSAELAYLPSILTPVTDEDSVKKLLRLTEALEELEDTQNVYDNSEIAPELMPDE